MNNKDVLVIAKGKRRYLHPQLEILEDVECDVWYDREFKFFYIEYDFVNGIPYKSLLTKDPGAVLCEIGRYKNVKMEEESERLDESYKNSRRE